MMQAELFETVALPLAAAPARPLGLPALLERLAGISNRPRYAFMVLNLIARAAAANGNAGPYVREGEALVPIRDWLSDALAPMAQRDPRRLALTAAIRDQLAAADALPLDDAEAERAVDAEVRDRVRRSARTNVSHAVSELVRAGLVKRHYAGYRVDHHNRGAQRQAVYVLTAEARAAMSLPVNRT